MKKLFLTLALICMTFAIFAQSGDNLYINDADVQNYINNFFEIVDELDEFYATIYDESYPEELEEAFINKVLAENGISGSNNIEKFEMISACLYLVLSEDEVIEYGFTIEELLSELLAEEDIEESERTLHDYQVIKKYAKEIEDLYPKIEAYFDEYDDELYEYDYYDNWQEDDYYGNWQEDDYSYDDYYGDWSITKTTMMNGLAIITTYF